jgi:hypothetical protein
MVMNDKFGRDGRYREDRFRNDDEYRREREAREGSFRHFDEDRGLRSPDREFETSSPYRQPREQPFGAGTPRYARANTDYASSSYDRSRFDGNYAPSYGAGWSESRYGWTSEARGGFAGRGPKGYVRTDERIREDVCDRLSWNDEVDATDIVVRVDKGEVTLEGSVETRHMKRLAADLAEDVPGVTDVHNTVRVKKPILTEVKEKLTGEASEHHYANTGTKTSAASARNGLT